MKTTGKIVTLSGISGIGKSFLKSYVLENLEDFVSLISVTTRSRRINEQDGVDKFFYSQDQFLQEYSDGKLCAVNNVFGKLYGYKKEQLDLCYQGVNLITELYYRNVREFKLAFPNVLSVYVLPLSVQETKKKLIERNLKSDDLDRRMSDIDAEISFYYENKEIFDATIENDYSLETCLYLTKLISEKIRGNSDV